MAEPTNTNQGTREEVSEYIATIRKNLDLDKTIQQYARVIETELQHHEVQVRSPPRTAAACLLMACRLRETTVRVTVLADQTSATKAQILNEIQRLSNELDIVIPLDEPPPIIEDTCRELALPETVENRAIQLANLGDEVGVTSGVSPYTYAAAVLYIVCTPTDSDLSQADIASHLDVSTAALRNRRDDLLEATGGRLFELQYPNAPTEAITLVNTLLQEVRVADWAMNKRFLGLVAGAWLFSARQHNFETTAADLATLTGISESTIQTRYDQFVDHVNTSKTTSNKPNSS